MCAALRHSQKFLSTACAEDTKCSPAGARAECKMIGRGEYHIHRWCPYTGYAEIVIGSDVPKTVMHLAMLGLGATLWAVVIVIAGVLT
jgi:hypothetical protein